MGGRGKLKTKPEAHRACRFCGVPLNRIFVDLGSSPLCQTYITPNNWGQAEPFYPLYAFVCDECWLVQLGEHVAPNVIFKANYPYYSSYSESWAEHARRYAVAMRQRFGIAPNSLVMEVGSNDGYLLRHFLDAGVQVLGIDPAAGVVEAAQQLGVETVVEFLGCGTAREIVAAHGKANLLVGNNVLAHVPDLNDFIGGIKILLGRTSVLTMEFPHLLRLIQGNQFDTIYHEHYFYFWFSTVRRIFAEHGITLFDVEELPTHGGSLRIYGRHAEDDSKKVEDRVQKLLRLEEAMGWNDLATYDSFAAEIHETKRKILDFLICAKREGKTIVGYGAPGKGNTLLNYCGIRTDFLDYTVDRNPQKQGNYTPGTRIPILNPAKIRETRPDYILILPWNLRDEIACQLRYVAEWGGKLVVPIPEPTVL